MRTIDASLIKVPLHCDSKQEAIEILLDLLVEQGLVSDRERVLEEIMVRERSHSTAIGYGAAIPHARSDHVRETVCAFGSTLDDGIDFGANGHCQLANLLFLMVSPKRDTTHHIKALARIARLVKNDSRRESLGKEHDPEAILDLLGDLARRE